MFSNIRTFLASALLSLFTFYVALFLTSLHNDSPNQSMHIDLVDDKELLSFTECNPFLKNAIQFRVEIDGQTYPRIIHLYQNASINFECLNRSRIIKKILLWNSFFGHRDFAYGIGKIEPFKRHNCPVTSCEILNEKVKINDFFKDLSKDSGSNHCSFPKVKTVRKRLRSRSHERLF